MRRAAKVDANQPAIWRCAECGCQRKATAHQMRQTYCSRECMAKAYARVLMGDANPNHRGAGHHVCAQCGEAFHNYNKGRQFCSPACYAASRVVLDAKVCSQCEAGFQPKTRAQRYCSAECSRVARSRVTTPKMIQPRAAPQQAICPHCESVFQDVTGQKVYCSSRCGSTARAASRRRAALKPKREPHLTDCHHCGQTFRSSPSQGRQFCSYECHLSSGGAKRAGEAAAMAKSRYGAKKDANHNDIFDAIRGLNVPIYDLSNVGCGVPDGVAWVKGAWHLLDVKNPETRYGKRGLNARQRRWLEEWKGGPVYLIYTVDEALLFAQGKFDTLKRHDGGSKDALAVIGMGVQP